MKRALVMALAWVMVLAISTESHAFLFGKKKTQEPAAAAAAAPAVKDAAQAATAEPQVKQEASKQEAAVPKVNKAEQQTRDLKRKAVEQKRMLLNNTEWSIEMMPLSGKEKKDLDVLLFKNSQVSSIGFGKRGFPASNFTLTIQDDGTIIWETMQTSEKAGIVFWRGEIDPEVKTMRGIISHKVDEKTSEDYSFAATGKRDLPVEEQK